MIMRLLLWRSALLGCLVGGWLAAPGSSLVSPRAARIAPPLRSTPYPLRPLQPSRAKGNDDGDGERPEATLGLKAVWAAAELFGQAAAAVSKSLDKGGESGVDAELANAPATRGEAVQRLRDDYDRLVDQPRKNADAAASNADDSAAAADACTSATASGRDYFVSGQVDAALYAEDCVFADPFASFAGRQRFIDNLQNLGAFITGARLVVPGSDSLPC